MRRLSFAVVLVALLGLRLATLPILPLLDPTEARYATVARDMLQSGDLVTPMIWSNGEYVPFLSKPPLTFWLTAVTMRAFGAGELAARLPSFLASLGVLLSTWLVLRRLFSGEVLASALLILLSSPLFFFAAGFVLTDMLLCFAVSLALLAFYASTCPQESAQSERRSLVVFASLGLGMLAKGPVSLVLFGIPVAFWMLWKGRSIARVRRPWLLGGALFLALWLPWYAVAEFSNPGFLGYFFVNENFLRYISPNYQDRYGGGHRFPYGAAIAFLVLAALPWFLLLGWKVRAGDRRRRALASMKDPALQFFALVVGTNVAFLCFSRHILGTYVLPLLPAAAVLFASVLTNLGFGVRRVALVSVILVSIYASALTLGDPLIGGRWSAKSVLDEARWIQEERHADGQIIFIEKVPFSAHFYGGPDVFHLPWDAGNEHYEGYLVPTHGDLFVLNPTHGDRLDPYVMQRLTKIADCGFYSIWEPTAPDSARAAFAGEAAQATLTGRSESSCLASSSARASASPSSVSWASKARARLLKPRPRSESS